MKAAVLNAFGSPLAIETVPDPLLGTGEVIVDVAASRVLAYANEVLSGERKYLLELPVVPGPGAIGRIRATGPDATRLRPGDWVYCDPTVRSRDNALSPDIALQGLTAGSEGGLRLQRYFHDGAWAEQMRLPTENAVPIGDIDEKDAGRWCALGTLLVPYGGFLAANLQAGEIALVNGATGSFGSAAVAVALGMGVQCVVATGRNEQALTELTRRFGARVRTVPMRAFHMSWFAFFLCFFGWFGIAPLMPVIREELHLTKEQIGNTISVLSFWVMPISAILFSTAPIRLPCV